MQRQKASASAGDASGRIPARPKKHWMQGRRVEAVLFLAILGLGIFARTWEYRQLPPGLNPDEASIGVEAYYLSHFGMDRNGNSYPVLFVSWGSGQNALYGYVLMPFVAILGLSPVSVRLPMLLAGILSLPLMFLAGQRLSGVRLGLLSMLLLAISPWHILLSRWGLEANLLPFVLLAAYVALLYTRTGQPWFVAACVLLATALYAYATAYAMVPLFLGAAAIIMARARAIRPTYLMAGIVSFAILATPIALFIIVNALHQRSLQLGPVTIPLLPVRARFESATLLSGPTPLLALASNLRTMLRLLVLQSDGLIYNVVAPYGYFYAVTLPVAAAGCILLVRWDGAAMQDRYLLLAWVGAALAIGLFQSVNINRLNAVFIPLLLGTAVCIEWMGRRWPIVFATSIVALLGAFLAFTIAYHGTSYGRRISRNFQEGILPSIRLAAQQGGRPICITSGVNMPYIYALFTDRPNPDVFLSSVQYLDPSKPLRRVRSFGRYTFGTENCTGSSGYIYVLRQTDAPPNPLVSYESRHFGDFVVYLPKP